MRHVVGKAADLPPGQRVVVLVNGLSIGVFNVNGEYYALLNRCAHQGGPLCLGTLTGLAVSSTPGEVEWTRRGEILRCPWHLWEYDVRTGKTLVDPQKVRVRTYEVTVEPSEAEEGKPPEVPSVPTYPVTVESGWVVLHVMKAKARQAPEGHGGSRLNGMRRFGEGRTR